MEKDSESGSGHDEKRIESQRRHDDQLGALADPDAHLSVEERAQIVGVDAIAGRKYC